MPNSDFRLKTACLLGEVRWELDSPSGKRINEVFKSAFGNRQSLKLPPHRRRYPQVILVCSERWT